MTVEAMLMDTPAAAPAADTDGDDFGTAGACIRPLSEMVWLYRQENGLSQAELAKRAAISRATISGIERGITHIEDRSLSGKTRKKIAALLNIGTKQVWQAQMLDKEAAG